MGWRVHTIRGTFWQEIERLKQENQVKGATIDMLQTKLDEWQREYESLKRLHKDLQADCEQIKRELQPLRQQLEGLRRQLDENHPTHQLFEVGSLSHPQGPMHAS
jgi:predicted RNase H-like nuclease (RuvC/YqgF family)